MTKSLYKFSVNCGRMFKLEGLFISTKEEVKNLVGKSLYFSDVLGKHSEIEFEVELDHIEFISDASMFIAFFEKAFGESFGYNPFDYIQESEEEY